VIGKTLVLGSGGSFAQNYIRRCASEGIEVIGIGRSIKSRPFWNVPKGFRYYVLHLVTQLPEILRIIDVEKPEVIVNFAAQGEGAASFGDNAPDFFTTNTTALTRLALGIPKDVRFVQIGSSEVYGSVREPATESTPIRPTSPYSISKGAFDQYLEVMFKTQKFPMNIIRPSNCYVEGQQLYRIIPKTILCALKKEKLPLHGGGVAEKSYLHADDLSDAIIKVLNKGKVGEIYNVGPDSPIAIRSLVSVICKIMDIPWDQLVDEVGDRMGQDSKYHLNSDKIKELGWKQNVKLWQGIHSMVSWVQTYPELLEMSTEYSHRA
jgi:dTDP-glucose 4,6-dehydratase